MNSDLIILIFAAAFFAGLAAGYAVKHGNKTKHCFNTGYSQLADELNEEYRNFLSYDGTVQM